MDNNKNLFTCTVEPLWGKPAFTMQKVVTDRKEALKLVAKYKKMSGKMSNYSNFRYEGELI